MRKCFVRATAIRRFNLRLQVEAIERLESRWLLSAHVLGDPAVYATIQAAVNAAPANATVTVDPGTYAELVTIGKSLALLGARAGEDARSPLQPVGESIISGHGIDIAANDVTVDGFTVRGQTSGSGSAAGIVIEPGRSGTHIFDDVIADNVAGLFLANSSDTDPAVIRHNVFADNNNPGGNSGRGIYTDGGVSGGHLTNVLVDANLFVGNIDPGSGPNFEAAIGLEAQGAGKQFNISITNNIMSGNGKGLLAFNVTGLLVSNNVINGCIDTVSGAVRIEGNVNGATINSNTLTGNQGAAISIIERFVGPSSNIVATGNNIAANPGGGLVVGNSAYAGVLDGRNNYWGDPSGPSGDGPGSGDSVVSNGTTVLFAPWSTTPNSIPALASPAPGAAGSGIFASDGSISLSGHSVGAIAGGIYVVKDFLLSGHAVLNATGPVTIYVTGMLTVTGRSRLRAISGLAGDVQIHVLGQAPVTFSGGSVVRSALDAIQSTVSVSGQSKFFGSSLDKLLELTGGGTFIPAP